MLDHQEARLWADNHAAFTRWVTDAAQRTVEVFAVLTAHHYDAPWRQRRHGGRDV